ncbi:unnamed protein product [Anisakis simplex]|uniref:ShKT domain-containing protein n=1 Tax=Anisakis simplex TaxID=6269 RepID=A0A3P6P506_ANISI|nr:unnamed protein product [Anisakis simplex]
MYSGVVGTSKCVDSDADCYGWVAQNHTWCYEEDTFTASLCDKSCQKCGAPVRKEFDLRRVPHNLQPIAFLIGKWRSEFGGKAFFPTIPRFTYGEEIVFSICDPHLSGEPSLYYNECC